MARAGTPARTERRPITAVFIDVVGSTELGVRVGPERMKRVLDRAFADVRDLTLTHGGTIEKYVGDAMFVLFGAPIAHGDDALRALRLAEALARWQRDRPDGIALRIGVESGEALVDLASLPERQRMAVGNAVNHAARLQQAAEPGQVLVGPACHAATDQLAEMQSVGPLALKGIDQTEAWRLVRVIADARVRPPFVGREAELAQIRGAFRRARSGLASLVVVIGPPGQGKSRLAERFTEEVRGEVHLTVARCRPGSEAGALNELRQILGPDEPRRLIRELELAGVADATSIVRALTHNAGLVVDPFLSTVDPVERQQRIDEAWRAYLRFVTRDRPAVLWVEDLHWAEPQFARWLDRSTRDAEIPLLAIATARPEFAESADVRPGDGRTFIELPPLDREAAIALAASVGGGEEVAERAAGNALFILELARSAARADAALPLTLQGAIGARLDELSEGDRALLQRSAVVGETFTIRGAALLSQRGPADVAGALGRLAHLRYLDQTADGYRFHHALVRDAAYTRLPVEERMRLHALYAQDGADPSDAEALAHHWWEALRPPDAEWVWEGHPELDAMTRAAFDAHIAAGLRSAERLSFSPALELVDRGRSFAAGPLDPARTSSARAQIYDRMAKGDESWHERLQALESYARGGAAPPAVLYADMLAVPVHNWGWLHRRPDERLLLRLMREGEARARAEQDIPSLSRLLGHRAFFTIDPAVAEEARALALTADDPREFADAIQRSAQSQLLSGQLEAAERTYRWADELVAAGASITRAEERLWRGTVAFLAGRLDDAERFADDLASIARSIHAQGHALGVRARVRAARGDWPGALRIAQETEALVSDHAGVSFCPVPGLAFTAGAVATILDGRPRPMALDALAERADPTSEYQRAGITLLPNVMAGLGGIPDAARHALVARTCWDRQNLDVLGFELSIALVQLKLWDEVAERAGLFDKLSTEAGELAAAFSEALREEIAAASGGPRPRHSRLRHLGYIGFSELLSFHPRRVEPSAPTSATAP